MLGKRKREVEVVRRIKTADEERTTADQGQGSDPDVFRKHFEAMFEPLPQSLTMTALLVEDEYEKHDESAPQVDSVDVASDVSAWDGFSEADDEADAEAVEIVEHRSQADATETAELERLNYKKFMVRESCWNLDDIVLTRKQSSRPPREVDRVATIQSKEDSGDEDGSEALNLKHDLDLQRLLKESHLLEQAKASTGVGVHRHKAVDMRLQTLGSKGSTFQQEKMPLAHRKGILAKAASRDASRRKEAKDSGIILEKVSITSRSKDLRRERTVDVPTIGKFRDGTLRLSKKDVMAIQGPPRSGRPAQRGRR
jgi:hypothetical protein